MSDELKNAVNEHGAVIGGLLGIFGLGLVVLNKQVAVLMLGGQMQAFDTVMRRDSFAIDRYGSMSMFAGLLLMGLGAFLAYRSISANKKP